jgi:hypothetical protein
VKVGGRPPSDRSRIGAGRSRVRPGPRPSGRRGATAAGPAERSVFAPSGRPAGQFRFGPGPAGPGIAEWRPSPGLGRAGRVAGRCGHDRHAGRLGPTCCACGELPPWASADADATGGHEVGFQPGTTRITRIRENDLVPTGSRSVESRRSAADRNCICQHRRRARFGRPWRTATALVRSIHRGGAGDDDPLTPRA